MARGSVLEVRTWWRGRLEEVCCFRTGEVTVGWRGAHLFLPFDGPATPMFEYRGGWIATEAEGWLLMGGGRRGAPLRWREVGHDAPVRLRRGDWVVDARRVTLPRGIGRPRERPWLSATSGVVTGLAAVWLFLAPPGPEFSLTELRDSNCGGFLLLPDASPTTAAVASPHAGAGPGRGVVAGGRPTDPGLPPVPSRGAEATTGLDEHHASLSADAFVNGPHGGPAPWTFVGSGDRGLGIDGVGTGGGMEGPGSSDGAFGLGAERGGHALSTGWTRTSEDARVAVVPRSSTASFDLALASLRAGDLPEQVDVEAFALRFTDPVPEPLRAELIPHPAHRGRHVLRVIADLDVGPDGPAHLGIHVDVEALQNAGQDHDVRRWLKRRIAELPRGTRVTIWAPGVRIADAVPTDERALDSSLDLWEMGSTVPSTWLPDDLDAVLLVGTVQDAGAFDHIATTAALGDPTVLARDGVRVRTYTEVPIDIGPSASIGAVEVDLDPSKVWAWRVLGYDGAHLSDAVGPLSDARITAATTGRSVVLLELASDADLDPAAVGLVRLQRTSGLTAREEPIGAGHRMDVGRAWAAAALAMALNGDADPDWPTLEAQAAGSPTLTEAVRRSRALWSIRHADRVAGSPG